MFLVLVFLLNAVDPMSGVTPKRRTPILQVQNDSLRRELAMRDSVLREVATRAIAVNMPTPEISVVPDRDWFDWVSLGASLLVAPIIALYAAERGAVRGGEVAGKAGLEVQKQAAKDAANLQKVEAQDARRLRDEERHAAAVRERALLLRRLERDLITAGGIADGLAKTKDFSHVMPVAQGNLQAMWDSFVARRDALMLLADPDLEHEIEHFYEFCFSRSGFFGKYLATETELLSLGNPDWKDIHARAAIAENDVRKNVDRLSGFVDRIRRRIAEVDNPTT